MAAGLVLPCANTEAMNLHLAEIALAIAPGAHAALRRENDPPDHFLILLILDGAGWHGGKDLVVPQNITPITLPPPDRVRGRLYSPELNPHGNVCQYLRANKLASTVFDSYDEILDQCSAAWNFFANDQAAITSITSGAWAEVNVQGRWYQRIFCPVFAQSFMNCSSPLSVSGCDASPMMTDGGAVITSAPISAHCVTWFALRIEAARICVLKS